MWLFGKKCTVRFKCKQSWWSLQGTDDERVRYCKKCKKTVTRCYTRQEFIKSLSDKECMYVLIEDEAHPVELMGDIRLDKLIDFPEDKK